MSSSPIRTKKDDQNYGVYNEANASTGEDEDKYERWGREISYSFSCLGFAANLGSIVRFPYICYIHGGGAFLFAYTITMLFLGIPLFLLEASVGQFTSKGMRGIFQLCPLLSGAVLSCGISNFLASSYYLIFMAYSLYYIAYSFTGVLPWTNCDNDWNTKNCTQSGFDNYSSNNSPAEWHKAPSEEFFHYSFLHATGGFEGQSTIVWQLFACTLIAWLVLFFITFNGIERLGKALYASSTVLLLFLCIILIRGSTLPGSSDGISKFLIPVWSDLESTKIWTDAALQMFFSLGIGRGFVVSMTAYKRFRHNTLRDSLTFPLLALATSILSGMIVFSVLGYISHQSGIPLKYVITKGPTIIFVTIPVLLATMPVPQLWSVAFHALLFSAGIIRLSFYLQLTFSEIYCKYGNLDFKKQVIDGTHCLMLLAVSLLFTTDGGVYNIKLVDWFVVPLTAIVVVFCEITVIAWIYGITNHVRDVQFMLKKKFIPGVLQITWSIYSPLIILIIFCLSIMNGTSLSYGTYQYSPVGIATGWLGFIISISGIPIKSLYILIKYKCNVIKATTPSTSYGPDLKLIRKEWEDYCTGYTVGFCSS